LRYAFKPLKIKTKYKNPSHVGLEIKTKNKNPTYLGLSHNKLIFLFLSQPISLFSFLSSFYLSHQKISIFHILFLFDIKLGFVSFLHINMALHKIRDDSG